MASIKRPGIASLVIIGLSLCATVALADIVRGISNTAVSEDVAYTTVTLTKPSGSTVGDFLLASISVNGGSPAEITAPSGWTLITRTDNDTNISILSYWKAVGFSEPSSYVWTINPQTRATGGITRYSGINIASPIDVIGTSTGRGTVATAPSVTTTQDGERIVGIFATNEGKNNSPTFSTTTGYTKMYDKKYAPLGPTTSAEDKAQSTTGASGSIAVTISNGAQRDWAAQTLALKMEAPPIFSDTFNRADGVLGNGWTVNSNSEDCTAGVSSNQGYLTGDPQLCSIKAYRDDISPGGAYYIVAKVRNTTTSLSPGMIASHALGTPDPANADGYGLIFSLSASTDNILIYDTGSGAKATGSYSFNADDVYVMDIEYSGSPQNWVDAYIWDQTASESKPSTPTLSFHNDGANYIPAASGSNFTFHMANGTGGVNTMYLTLYEVGNGTYNH